MTKAATMSHEFVDELPDEFTDGVLYVSIPFATAGHLCCCGCGNPVYTPLRPNRWRMTFDGESISLEPSVGNWNFPCQSHYWLERGKVRWAPGMTRREIDHMRERAREGHVAAHERVVNHESAGSGSEAAKPSAGRIRAAIRGLFKRGTE
ncbi:MAG TPA: DUF6527 family protein [Solirubrobacteraceae bacterium]|jgi:hypothetical protein|nr:DUF6527 family protein [Solirubrobacteraceae bacterium]